jgi:hypothetical protein
MRRSLVRATIAGTSALAIFAALPTIVIGVARADEYSFLEDMESAGFVNQGGNGAEIGVGYHICAEIAAGTSPSQAARELWLDSHLNEYEAAQFVRIAVDDLCPENV